METACQSARPWLGMVALLAVIGERGAVAAEWKFDVMRLKNGRSWSGMLVEETKDNIWFQCVEQKPGKRTFVFAPAPYHRQQVDAIEKLRPEERQQLAKRLEALKAADPMGNGEKQRLRELELKAVGWFEKPKGGLRFESEQFILDSNANEEIVRRAAVRLEDIYAAYTGFLPPRRQKPTPTRIFLVESLAEYQKRIQPAGKNIFSMAFFNRETNVVFCASDLDKMGADLEFLRQKYAEIRSDCARKEKQLEVDFGHGKVPESHRLQIFNTRKHLIEVERYNEQVFAKETQRLFQRLYHEAFHAYLDNFVYDPDQADVPRWLNEGLAQIFETAIVEAGELRVGHADEVRLKRVRDALKNKSLVPLAQLLKAGPDQYLALHGSDQKQSGDLYYLTAWGVAFYLTFDRNILGSKRLDDYVQQCRRGADPLDAFGRLVDQSPSDFETGLKDYLGTLRPDGTAGALTAPRP